MSFREAGGFGGHHGAQGRVAVGLAEVRQCGWHLPLESECPVRVSIQESEAT